ncbi:MAG: hypothetical protein Fur006_30910 [Coleofasciculaceae cyanobacterium]
MPRPKQSQKIYTTLGFQTSHPDGNLIAVEIIGVPGQKLQNGECNISERIERFFDETIAKPIFRSIRRFDECDFSYLKIWLYATDEGEDGQGYQVPPIDERDLEFESNIPESNLKFIYVLDNELQGTEYRRWEKTAKAIFNPLFKEFVAPPEIPSSFPFPLNPFSPFMDSLEGSLDPYAKLKRELFFDALIIQVD